MSRVALVNICNLVKGWASSLMEVKLSTTQWSGLTGFQPKSTKALTVAATGPAKGPIEPMLRRSTIFLCQVNLASCLSAPAAANHTCCQRSSCSSGQRMKGSALKPKVKAMVLVTQLADPPNRVLFFKIFRISICWGFDAPMAGCPYDCVGCTPAIASLVASGFTMTKP